MWSGSRLAGAAVVGLGLCGVDVDVDHCVERSERR